MVKVTVLDPETVLDGGETRIVADGFAVIVALPLKSSSCALMLADPLLRIVREDELIEIEQGVVGVDIGPPKYKPLTTAVLAPILLIWSLMRPLTFQTRY